MEVYSTLLWHLQRNVKLSFLAQELLSTNPRSPQAWIAVGNCFSLQKEKAQALTCFRRAAQLDPTCAYAFTLSGHESIDEDVDGAINFFQSALRADPRHYNAWYVGSLSDWLNEPFAPSEHEVLIFTDSVLIGMDWAHAICG